MSADVVPPSVRSRMMAGIKGKDTKPELLLRAELHRRGFRFRLHRSDLPGRPDLVFPKWQAVIFAHGCFWHGHDCHLFKLPQSRTDFWRDKIAGNVARDHRQLEALLSAGWRVGVVWECSLKGRNRLPLLEVIDKCAAWLTSAKPGMEIHGDQTGASGRLF